MTNKNDKLFEQLNELKANKGLMPKHVYIQELRALKFEIQSSLIVDMEVSYEEFKIMKNVDQIIKP